MPIQDSNDDVREGSRIAKVMARAGLCSRRDAEQWIAEGRVKVNGEVLTSPAYNVSEADEVLVDGQPLRAAERTRLFLFHKPRGLVTTAKDPEGRPTIFDALPEDLPRVVAVGRLDINTEGLILLTNDGGLSRVLELPATGWLRRYRVRAHGEITQEQLDGLRNGVTIDGIDYLGIDAKFERQQGSNVWLTMGLREGKNREIKRVLEHMGLSVNRLIRVSFGPFELGDLPEGELMEVRTRVLRDQLGPKLAKQAGANFEAPIETPVAPPEPPRGDRPMRRPRGGEPAREDAPRKRKHVSVLREEAREEAAGPRKRVTRTATADRKGREVKVERVSLVNPPMDARPKRRPAGDGFGPRKTPREGFEPRAQGASGERRSFGRASGEGFEKRERAPRGEGFEKRDRAPRSEGASGERRSFGGPSRRPSGEGFEKRERAPRGEGFEKRERAPRTEGASGERRSFGGPSRRSSGEGFEKRERAPRGEGFEKRERAPRTEGASGERRGFGGPSRRASGEGSEKRAPRGEGRSFGGSREGGEKRPPRAGGPQRGGRPGGPKGPPRKR